MSDACDLLVRGRAACKALRGPPAVGALDAIACKPLDTRAEYSADGRFLAVVEEGALRVLDAVSGAVLLDQPRPQVQALSLSPRGSPSAVGPLTSVTRAPARTAACASA